MGGLALSQEFHPKKKNRVYIDGRLGRNGFTSGPLDFTAHLRRASGTQVSGIRDPNILINLAWGLSNSSLSEQGTDSDSLTPTFS